MKSSVDVYAMTNPALGAVAIASFAKGFADDSGNRPDFPLAFLPLPLVLASPVLQTFRGTNRKTGLVEWLAKSPEVLVDFDQAVRASVDYSRSALLFGVRYGVLSIDPFGRVEANASAKRVLSQRLLGEDVREAVRAAERLGCWFAEIRSTETILHCLGIRI